MFWFGNSLIDDTAFTSAELERSTHANGFLGKAFGQAWLLFKDQKRATSVALNSYLTYITLPWHRIIAGTLHSVWLMLPVLILVKMSKFCGTFCKKKFLKASFAWNDLEWYSFCNAWFSLWWKWICQKENISSIFCYKTWCSKKKSF